MSPASPAAPRFVPASELEGAALMAPCIAAVEQRMARGWDVAEPARTIHRVGDGQLLMMPGWDRSALAVKLNTLLPDGDTSGGPRVQGVVAVFDLPTMVPVLLVDAAAFTALRTPAVSAVAAKHLARPDASRLVVFGAGPQAAGHVEAMRAVRDISWVGIVSRTHDSAERLAAGLRAAGVEAEAVAAGGVDRAVATADLVCTCTTSRTPVFDGSLLHDGAHVTAVGSHEPTARELDDATMAGAAVAVDSVEMALREAGDVVLALESGALADANLLMPLPAVVRAEVSAAGTPRTVFKSVGTAGQDLVTAQLLIDLLGG